MKLSKGAKIITVDGQEIGRLSRFVLDPKTKNITNIVFQHGLLGDEEYVIPMRLVDHVDEAGIHLDQLPIADPKELPMFLEEQFLITDENALLDQGGVSEDQVNTYYHYPPTPLGAGIGPGFTQMGIPISGEPPVIKQTKENIPSGTVSVKEGSKVYTNDGKYIGNVEKIFSDANSGQMTHIVITKGLLLKERKHIPVDWISDIHEDEIHLAIDQPFAERLPDYKEK